MGMFDYIRCEHKLSGSPNVEEWQTKDTPDQWMSEYVITKDGTLKKDGKIVSFDGIISFYGMTKTGKWYEYEAGFKKGQLVSKIKSVEISR